MKKKLFSLLAVILMTLAANAQKTITWDYNTIKGIDFECHDQSNFFIYPVISKDGITLSVNALWSSFTFKDCDFSCSVWDLDQIPEAEFFSTVGRIKSIVITCTDENDALHDDANKYGWTESPTSASWSSGDPLYKVMLPMEDNTYHPMEDIQKITFTVDNVVSNHYRIYSINGNWEINGEKVWKGLDYAEAGEKVVINPDGFIPEGKKIKSMKVVDLTSDKTTYLTDNGDGTWTLAAMPAYNVKLVVVYEGDEPDPGTKYTISNIPSGWKVNGSTTSGTYKAEEGAEVIFTPANIPAGKKIKSIKVVKQ